MYFGNQTNIKIRRLGAFATAMLVWAFAIVCPPKSLADVFPTGCDKASGGQGNTSTTGINFNRAQAHVGDTVQVFPTFGMVGPQLPQTGGGCEAQNATGSVYIASGLLVVFLNNVTLDPGFIYNCPTNTSPPCTAGPYNVTITPALVGAGVTYPEGSISGTPNTVRSLQWSFSDKVRSNPSGFETLDKIDTASIAIVHPCILVTKRCVLPTGQTCFTIGQNAQFTGIVTNCGDINLTNVIANDTRTGRLTLLDPVSGLPIATNANGGINLPVGAFANYSTSYTPSLTEFCAGTTLNSVTATGTDTSDIGGPNASVTNSTSANCPLCVTPCISVTKACTGPVVVGDPQTISGVVSNCGNITLTNVTVTDNVLGAVTNIGTLNPGQAVNYSLTFTSGCNSFTNTVTASGTSLCGQGVQATATAPCFVTQTPCISVTKNCIPSTPVQPGAVVTFSGVVTNCGNVALTNVVLNDTFLGKVIATIPRLEKGGTAGSSAPYTTNYTTTVADASRGTITNTVIATGLDACDGHQVQSSASCTFSVSALPCIGVTKEVACYLGNNTCGTFGKFAIGVQGDTEEPAFCYRITITNCSPTVTLTNVTVVDTIYGDLTANFSCIVGGVLSPATGCSFVFRASVGTTDNTINYVTNVVTLTGTPTTTGQVTNAIDHAAVEVVPAKVTCNKQYTIDGGPLTNNVTLSDQNPHTIVWYVTINNVGIANLGDVTVTDVGLPCVATVGPFSLDSGASTTFPICTNASFICTNSGIENTITVMNDVFTLGTNHIALCHVALSGTNVTVRTECSAMISCVAPAACRVTGGGRQDVPEVCPTDVRYVTHGGQVGAPVGNKVCVIDTSLPDYWLGNPCIHGRWTHVRHMQGGLEGNFHARFFDTLDCACLDTNMDANCHYGPGTVVDSVCGNRNIGPEPRKAPANKIVFTGVGDWNCESGRRAPRSVLFRVDIEDRGEPGNFHALDSSGKQGRVPDRYRIRIWVLTDAELAQLNGSGPDPYLIHFRDCISACNGIDYQDGVCGPNTCSGDPCTGEGTTGTITFPGGCPVRSPNIDDGGALEHGNHQIHPSIKSCDPANPTGPGLAKP